MSKENPYAAFLDRRPVDAILASTPGALRAMLDRIGAAEAATRPAPGKWSASEIACHLADCELVFGFRLRQMLAEDNPVVQPFDQDKWAANYAGIDAEQAMQVFAALRGWNLQLIRSAMPAAAGRLMTHPERGVMTFQTAIETIAGHDLNHLEQLRRIAGAPAA